MLNLMIHLRKPNLRKVLHLSIFLLFFTLPASSHLLFFTWSLVFDTLFIVCI